MPRKVSHSPAALEVVSSFPARMVKLTTVPLQHFLDTFNHRQVLALEMFKSASGPLK